MDRKDRRRKIPGDQKEEKCIAMKCRPLIDMMGRIARGLEEEAEKSMDRRYHLGPMNEDNSILEDTDLSRALSGVARAIRVAQREYKFGLSPLDVHPAMKVLEGSGIKEPKRVKVTGCKDGDGSNDLEGCRECNVCQDTTG